MPLELVSGPFVVLAVADHNLDLVMGGEDSEIFIAVSVFLTRPWGLEIHHFLHPLIYARDIQGAAGFQRNLVASVAKLLEKRQTRPLGQGFPACHRDILSFVTGYLVQYLLD
jgi:hypothetical protein